MLCSGRERGIRVRSEMSLVVIGANSRTLSSMLHSFVDRRIGLWSSPIKEAVILPAHVLVALVVSFASYRGMLFHLWHVEGILPVDQSSNRPMLFIIISS